MAWTGPLSRVAGPVLLSATLLVGVVLRASIGLAQITLDRTNPGGFQTLVGPAFTIPSSAGSLKTPVGGGAGNLFFSFGQFSVPTGGSATFTRSTTTSQASVSNIVGRVTGTDVNGNILTGNKQSSIDGLLAVASGTTGFAAGTNLWLINPYGVVFGSGARLNVPGSFHVSTADYLKFPGGIQYSARPVSSDLLSAAAPTAFGFLGATPPAAISIQGSTAAPILQVSSSATALAQTLSIVGGDVTITGPAPTNSGTVLARGGLVQIISVKSAGEVIPSAPVPPLPGQPPLASDVDVSGFSQLGAITLANGAVIDAGGRVTATTQPSGTVLLRGGSLQLGQIVGLPGPAAGASIFSSTTGLAATANPVGATRAIDIRVSGAMSLDTASRITSATGFRGLGGGIVAEVGSFSLTGGSQIARTSQSSNTGTTGGVTINATGPLTISGVSSSLTNFTLIGENLGPVTISGSSLTMGDGGSILSRSGAPGPAGGGIAGDITVALKGPLTMTGGATITGSASSTAAAPKVTVTADAVLLSGHGPLGAAAPSGIISSTAAVSAVVGDISLDVGSLTVTDSATIQSGSSTSFQGGNVSVTAREPVVISAGGSIASQANRADVGRLKITAPALTIDNGLVKTSTVDSGKAGDIIVTLDKTLSVTNGGQIQSNAINSSLARGGAGGNVTISAGESVSLAGAASGVFSTTNNMADAGRITVTTPSLALSDGAKLSVTTQGLGAAGDIVATVGKTLSLTNGGQIQSNTTNINPTGGPGGNVTISAGESVSIAGAASGVFSTTNNTGNAGRIGVTTPSLAMTDGAKLSVTTQGGGAAGDIVATLGKTLSVTNGGQIQSSTTNTNPAVGGAGGNVTITANESVTLAGAASGVFSTTDNPGNAGRITVTTPSLALSDGAKMSVTTQGLGRAGDIVVTVDKTLSVTNGGQIQSNTTNIDPTSGGAGGNVTITANGSMALAGAASGIFSTTDNPGNAGRITVTTPSLAMSDGAKISVTTQGAGRAGDIALNLSSLAMAGGARIDSGTSGGGHGGHITISAPSSVNVVGGGVSSNATAGGPGGNVSINTAQMALTEHATISATSTGTRDATAGNIAVVIGNSLRMRDSAITTAATIADGGNISITTTGSLLYLLRSRITTSVQSGFGQGGNITIGSLAHPIEFVVLNGSEIRADAFGGPGGNIDVFAGTFLTSSSILSASSALGVPGTIGIQAGVTDVSSSVSQLPESVLQASTLLRAACATRLAGGQSSSLVVSGREGLPAEPGGVLPSPLVAEGPADSSLSLDDSPGHDDPSNRIALWVPAPRCLR